MDPACPRLESAEESLAGVLFKALFICLANTVQISITKPIGGGDSKAELLKRDKFPSSELGIGIYPGYAEMLKRVSHSSEDSDAFRFFQVN